MKNLKIKNKQHTFNYGFLICPIGPYETGLPMRIFVKPCTGEKHLPILHVNRKHGKRKGEFGNWVTVTIEDEPKIYGRGLSKNDFYLVREYIRLNKNPLIRLWDDKIDPFDFIKESKRLESVKIDIKERHKMSKLNKLLEMQIDEMANAIQKYTGVNGVIYFCTKEELSNAQAHSLGRVKLIRDDSAVSVSIKKDKQGNRIIKGTDKRMIRDLIKFIELNEDLLWEYWNTPANEADSVDVIKKFIKI